MLSLLSHSMPIRMSGKENTPAQTRRAHPVSQEWCETSLCPPWWSAVTLTSWPSKTTGYPHCHGNPRKLTIFIYNLFQILYTDCITFQSSWTIYFRLGAKQRDITLQNYFQCLPVINSQVLKKGLQSMPPTLNSM